MKFEVLTTKIKKALEGFYVKINSNVEDSELYYSFTVGPFSKEKVKYLEEIIMVLDAMKNHGDPEDYDNIEGFNFWFNECSYCDIEDDDPKFKFYETLKFKSESDSFASSWKIYDGSNYSLRKYEVYYLNDDGSKSKVKIIKE